MQLSTGSHTDIQARSRRLLSVLEPYEQVLVVMHDNPDPDAIASGWAIKLLVEARAGLPARLVGAGAIVRAENRHMVNLLNPPLELVDVLCAEPRTAAILVDCGPGALNHACARDAIQPVAVIDHHALDNSNVPLAFRDIRPHVAASASIAASYLREQGLEPGVKLATALWYALRTETRGSQTYHSQLDRSVLPWLTEHADPTLLAEIENAPLPRDYYGDLVLALQRTFLYDDAAMCLLPRAAGAEVAGEVADLLIRSEGIRRVLCGAIVGKNLVISVRTERGGDDAAQLLQRTLDGIGRGGGHAHRAGGTIANVGRGPRVSDDLQNELRDRWLAACGVDRQRGTRLVARREIVENLD